MESTTNFFAWSGGFGAEDDTFAAVITNEWNITTNKIKMPYLSIFSYPFSAANIELNLAIL